MFVLRISWKTCLTSMPYISLLTLRNHGYSTCIQYASKRIHRWSHSMGTGLRQRKPDWYVMQQIRWSGRCKRHSHSQTVLRPHHTSQNYIIPRPTVTGPNSCATRPYYQSRPLPYAMDEVSPADHRLLKDAMRILAIYALSEQTPPADEPGSAVSQTRQPD